MNSESVDQNHMLYPVYVKSAAALIMLTFSPVYVNFSISGPFSWFN